VVGCHIVVSLWGRRRIQWWFLPSVGRSVGIIIIRDPRVLELVDSRIVSFFVCCKLKSLEDDLGSYWRLWS